MKPSDFATTSGQKRDMSQSLLQTEMTDAVNTGIVDRADKSEKSLKSPLYSVGKGKRSSTGGAASAALDAAAKGGKGGKGGKTGSAVAADAAGTVGHALGHKAVHGALEGSELEGADDLYGAGKGSYRAGRAIGRRIRGRTAPRDMDKAIKRAGSAVARSAASGAIEDTELEGADSAADAAVVGYRAVQGAKKRLSGQDALAPDDSLGKLSQKKSAEKAMTATEAGRKAQASGYFKRSVYSTAETAAKAKTAGKAASGMRAVVRSGPSGGVLAAFSPMSLVLAIIIAVLFFLLLLGGIGADEEEKRDSTGSLQGVPAEVATYLKGYGYTNEAIAGILGNMAQENSAFDPGLGGDDGYGTDSIGLIQLSGANKNNFLRWCANNGKVWSTVSAQMEWTFSGEPGTGYFAWDWKTHLAPSYYRLERGYEGRFGNDFYRTGEEIKTSTDVDLVTYSFMACHERCGSKVSYGDDVSRLYRRLERAHDFLAQLRSSAVGGGQELADAEQWQRDIVDACSRVPWPGSGLCATWTSRVYAAAGHPVRGNGNSVLGHQGFGASYYPSRATTDLSQIKVGMLVSAQFGTNSQAGNTYGHVGIYIGNGTVMDSIDSGLRTIPLSEWTAENGRGWVVCGYPWDWR